MTGADIRSERQRLGLTQAALGELVEPPVARVEISKLEAGKRNAGRVMAHRLRVAFKRAEEQPR